MPKSIITPEGGAGEEVNFAGVAQPVTAPAPLDVDVQNASLPVTSSAPLDVSAATVPVSSPAPLDVSAATVPVSSPAPLDVSGAVVDVDASGFTVPVSVQNASVPVTSAATLTVGFAGAAQPVLEERPSSKPGRTYTTVTFGPQAGNSLVRTNTPTKTFYVTSLVFQAFNTNVASPGTVQIKDSATNRLVFAVPQAGATPASAAEHMVAFAPSFIEPLRFTADINVQVPSGTVTWSLTAVGYEE